MGSNKLYIDNDTTSNPLIWGDLLNDSIRINGNLSVAANLNLTGNLYCNKIVRTEDIWNDDYFGTGNINLQNTLTDSLGVIRKSGSRFIHNYRPDASFGGNTFIGLDAGSFTMICDSAFEASNNTGVGKQALKALTTGYSNTAVGSATLIQNTTGYNNTAQGSNALYSNVSGWGNVAIGTQALFKNTDKLNVGVGYNCLFNLVDGDVNVAVGDYSGFSNVSGSDNTYLGNYTGFYSTGSGNLMLGYRAGYNETGSNKLYIDNDSISTPLIWGDFANDSIRINGNLSGAEHFNLAGNVYCNAVITSDDINSKDFIGTGFINVPNTVSDSTGVIRKDGYRFIHNYRSASNDGQNTFIGIDAGNFTMAGPGVDNASYNTGLGSQALNANTSGAFNTAVGSTALQSNTTGSGNVMLGYQAGNEIITGSYNTAVGYAAGCSTNDTNTIAIGYLASVDTSNQVRLGNSEITSFYCMGAYMGTISSDKVELFADNTGKIGHIPSSSRYKENISDLEDVKWIYSLKPVNFTYKSDEQKKKQYGFIAEEVEKVNPDFVHYNNAGQVETVTYSQLISPMIKAIQEQKDAIEELKNDINMMKVEREQLIRNQKLLMLRLEELEKEQEKF